MTRVSLFARQVLASILSAFVFAILPSTTVSAKERTEGSAAAQGAQQVYATVNRDNLNLAMQTLLRATMARDMETLLQFQPPRKIQKMAEAMGKSRQEALVEIAKFGRALDEQQPVEILTGYYDLETARFGKTSTGRTYALFNYSRTFKKESETFELTYPTLASQDGEHLFIIPLSEDKLLSELVELYPDLAEVKVPAAVNAP
ncbi:hypothetical protein [Alcaligenes faecalis]|uniref:hypothetical protein n=1 Tax=Alcaligenes faecalis TaxID=511 RepID=UPI00214FC053|nr:hypothetical protein [Alcaligenes faecalis]MCR4145560.1 hypothetical protein [Alcaligenes faecalis]